MTDGVCSCSSEPTQVEDALAVIKAHVEKLETSVVEATEEKTMARGKDRACQGRLGLTDR